MEQQIIITLVAQTCGECGIVFGMEEEYRNKLIRTNGTFYCPNGHCRVFTGKTEAQKLREELEQVKAGNQRLHNVLTQKNERIHHLEYSQRALKAAKTKILNRVKRGVCPCCNRSFANLQEHFKTKHPEIVNGN